MEPSWSLLGYIICRLTSGVVPTILPVLRSGLEAKNITPWWAYVLCFQLLLIIITDKLRYKKVLLTGAVISVFCPVFVMLQIPRTTYNAMHVATQRSRADADFYQMKTQAESNALLLTVQYLELKRYEAIANNTKIFFGTEIPKVFWPQMNVP